MYKQRRGFIPLRLKRAVCAAMLFGTAGAAYADVSVGEDIIENGYESEEANFNIVQVVSGLEHPWAVAWLPDGRMLVTERPGRLHLIDGDEIIALGNLPKIAGSDNDETPVEGGGQGGLLDVVVHPDYDENGWIYFTFSSPGDPRAFSTYEPDYGTGLAVGRARIDADNGELTDVETLYTQVPRTHPGAHYGSRIVFPGNGEIIFPMGIATHRTYPRTSLILAAR